MPATDQADYFSTQVVRTRRFFLPDWMEMQLGTDVNVEDSDGDGIPDGNEYGGGTDALAAAQAQDKVAIFID